MNIALSGYGRMGHEIETIALEKGYSVIAIFDNDKNWENANELLKKCDVVIDFSEPNAAPNVIETCFNLDIPVVSGTTGWDIMLNEKIKKANDNNYPFFYASNFSIGVNVFFKINKYLAKLISSNNDFNVIINETHHVNKLDKPSGTAVTIANDIISNSKYENWTLNSINKQKNTLLINSIREGDIFGMHSVKWMSEIDEIEITHIAKSRRGFACGAILAAEFIIGKKGFYTMDNLLYHIS